MNLATENDDRVLQRLEDGAAQIQEWRLKGRWEGALKLLDELRPAARGVEGSWPARMWLLTAQILIDQALFGGLDTFEPRQSILERALRQAEDAADPALLGDIWDACGMSLHVDYLAGDRGQEPEGELEAFERGFELRRKAGDLQGEGESRFHLGLYHSIVRRDEAQAQPHFEQALRLARECGDRLGESYAIRHLAIGSYLAGDLEVAREGLVESLRLRDEIGFIPGVAMAHKTLGSLYAEIGETGKALEHLESARDNFTQLGATWRAQWVQGEIDAVDKPPGE